MYFGMLIELGVHFNRRCNLTGPLPTDWVDSMPILSVVDINYNRIKGVKLNALTALEPGLAHTLSIQLSGCVMRSANGMI